ncbi:response regulator [Brevundimonas faecalis]|uniref:response regulator n=1 Tax=Brevundimonas faecalis TaxID=947378 RepID=UPI003605BC87
MSALQSLDILLADDNPNMRAIVCAMLKSIGVTRVREVDDGEAALKALAERPADMAIVDFKMAPMDGVAFTRAVRNAPDSPNPYLPIIMMTGHSDRRRVTEARDAGVTEFITKPVDPQALLGRVQAVILRPRSFIRSATYFGPDRRRTRTEAYAGPYRRSSDPKD